MPEQRKNLSRDKMNRLRVMPAGGFVVCDFVVCSFVVCDFVVCGTGGACDVEMGEKEERTGAQKNRLPSRAACSFLSSEFSSAGIFWVPRRWLSAGDGSALEIAQRCLAMSGFAQCRPLCGAVPRCFLSRRYRVGSRTGHKGITACARPGRPREIPVPGFSFWRPGGEIPL